jgi:L-iditol 2-dehydrogenase
LTAELLELPDGLAPLAGTFIEPLACVLRAQDRAGLHPGDALLVVGAGVNGLLQIGAAHARGIEAVWVREPRAERLERAEALGAELHGNEQVDVAIVCTPKPEAIAAAAAALAPGGTLCLYAPPAPGLPLSVGGSELFLRELTVTASYSAGPQDMRDALELIATRRIDPTPLVSHRVALEETGRALDLQRQGTALKVVVEP